MSKRTRPAVGFYKSIFNDEFNISHFKKLKFILKPTVMGAFEVERVVARRQAVGSRKKEYTPLIRSDNVRYASCTQPVIYVIIKLYSNGFIMFMYPKQKSTE